MARSKTMSEIMEIIRRLIKGQSLRAIQKETGVHRVTIRKVRKLANKSGWIESKKLPSEITLYELWCGLKEDWLHPLDNWQDDFKRWIDDGLTYVVMHQLIFNKYQCDESTVRRYVKRRFPEKPKPVITRKLIPGEIMDVDFGELGKVYDPDQKRPRKAWVFSARLRYSRKVYREECYDQKAHTFFEAHIKAFEYFGGVPEKVVPDNLKAAVIRASLEEPLINKRYLSLAMHYGFLISPTLPYHPHHKGGVENDIRYIKRNFWPRFKEAQRNCGHELPFSNRLSSALRQWTDEVEKRIVKGTGRTVIEMFEEELPQLKEIPLTRWEQVSWHQCKVDQSWRIQYDKSFYSVPYAYIGKEVEVMITGKTLRIFHNNTEIAWHLKADQAWQNSIKEDHGPPNYAKYLQTTQAGLIQLAEKIGNSTREVAKAILERKGSDGLKAARSLLGLENKFSPGKLEAACKRALFYNTPEYKSIKAILQKGLENLPLDDQSVPEINREIYRFARSNNYFNN